MRQSIKHKSLTQVLCTLSTKHGWIARDAQNVFISGNWKSDLFMWFSTYQETQRRTRQHNITSSSRKQEHDRWTYLNDTTTKNTEFLETKIDKKVHSTSKGTIFFTFTEKNDVVPSLRLGKGQDSIVSLPYSLKDAVGSLRSGKSDPYLTIRTEEKGAFLNNLSSISVPRQKLTDCVAGANLFGRHLADLVAIDLSNIEETSGTPIALIPPQANVPSCAMQDAFDAVTLSKYLLKQSGDLLLRIPLHVVYNSKDSHRSFRRYMQWSFQSLSYQHTDEHVYFLGSRCSMEHHFLTLPTMPFPGLRKKGEARPKKWNPRKSTSLPAFSGAVMPMFTNAPLVKEPLCHAIAAELKDEQKKQEKEDALFGVSVDMVTQKTAYMRRDD